MVRNALSPALGALLVALLLAAAASADAAQPTWHIETPPKPPEAPFAQPIGAPADISCLSATRCLLFSMGGVYYRGGFFLYDGVSWRRAGSVCGTGTDSGSTETTRVVWAGPQEFWTVTEPSAPRTGLGQGLCHFKDGEIVGSYSTPQNSPDRWTTMTAGACRGPDDCWFGGVGAVSPDGSRVGGFRVHWNGSELRTHYAPQGRAVSDMEEFAGDIVSSKFRGPAPRTAAAPDLADPEPVDILADRIVPSADPGGEPEFVDDGLRPRSIGSLGREGAELLALDAAGEHIWAGGGGAISGPGATSTPFARGPLLARRQQNGAWVDIDLGDSAFAPTEVFRDVAALPSGDAVWVVVQDGSQPATNSADAKIAKVGADGAVQRVTLLAAGGLAAGTAQRIECPTEDECWVITQRGLIFHLTDDTPRAAEQDPAFALVVAYRPNESLEQGLGDGSVVDDSLLFAPPPPVEETPVAPPTVRRLRPAIRSLSSKLKGRRLTIRFVVVRRARIGFTARRRGRTVARVRQRMLRPGRRMLSVKLDPKRWPDDVRFQITEPGQGDDDAADDNSVAVPAAVRR